MVKEMVEKLFPATKDVAGVVAIIEKYREKFGLGTGLRLAMFLAQVREEVGPEFKVMRESLNYKKEAAVKMFKNMTPELAEKYCRTDKHGANEEMVANIAYAGKLGNGDVASGDGWKYRGAGCLQVTGKGNFEEVQKRCVKYSGKEMDPNTLEGFIVFGMAFWMWQDLYKQADTGDVNKVTEKVNKYTESYEKRRKHFEVIKELIS